MLTEPAHPTQLPTTTMLFGRLEESNDAKAPPTPPLIVDTHTLVAPVGGKNKSFRYYAKTPESSALNTRRLATVRSGVTIGHLILPPDLEDMQMLQSTEETPYLGRVIWLEFLLSSPRPIRYMVFKAFEIGEKELIGFLEDSPLLNMLVIWEPVDSEGRYIPVITDSVIDRLFRHAEDGAIRPSSANFLPNLNYLELNGGLTVDPDGLVGMLKSRCDPTWHRTGVGLVPNIPLRSVCLHYHESVMDHRARAKVQQLFSQEDRKAYIYDDHGMDEVLEREMSVMFDTCINPDA